jgi:hypothetical protein
MDYWSIKTFKDWNYKSQISFSTGYENEYEYLNSVKKNIFNKMSEQEKEEVVQTVFNVYRQKNIYPIYYFNDEGISNEILRCRNKDVSFFGNIMDFRYTQGNTLLKFMFPNFQKGYSGIKDNQNYINSFDKFYSDEMLSGVIRFQLNYDSPIPLRLLNTMSLYRDRTPTNFSPMRSKALFERYVPKGGRIYDFSCGYGGRMLGALCSKNEYEYEGVDPSSETFDNLNLLGERIEKSLNRKKSFEIHKLGSEDYFGEKESIDFSFSSPPYFNLEKYNDEETQCYNRFGNIDDWFSQYVEKTIKNIYHMLKMDGLYAVNIADFNVPKGGKFGFVGKWIETSEKIGFENIDIISMKLSNRGGNKNANSTGGSNRKEEKIYVFKKVSQKNRNNYKNRKLPLFIEEKMSRYRSIAAEANSIKKDVELWAKESYFENIQNIFELSPE